MANRKKIVAGNWKMNLIAEEAGQLADDIITLKDKQKIDNDVQLILIPPYPYLDFVGSKISGHKNIKYGAQNCSEYEVGAYTGEVGAKILCSIGVDFVLIGHSERRKLFNEKGEQLTLKIKQVLKYKIVPIFCCGESLDSRKKNRHKSVVKRQIKQSLFTLNKNELSKLIIAYEPVWAIGTGETASPEQAQEMHKTIRQIIAEEYGDTIAEKIPILYGGSVNEKNARNLFSQEDVDGGLVGGASLKANSFIQIANSF